MSDVADGPETSVIGARSPRTASATRANASGTSPTICSARTTQMWWSGTSVIARRPEAPRPSRTIVPVWAIAAAQPVNAPSTSSSSAALKPVVLEQLDPVRPPLDRERRRDDEPAQPEAITLRASSRRELGGRDPADARRGNRPPIAANCSTSSAPLGLRRAPVVARHEDVLRPLAGRDVGQGSADAGEDLLARGAHRALPPPLAEALLGERTADRVTVGPATERAREAAGSCRGARAATARAGRPAARPRTAGRLGEDAGERPIAVRSGERRPCALGHLARAGGRAPPGC